MTPAVLRCESRRPGGLGLWRYSLAAMIVLAAILDAVWWVPSQQRDQRERERVQTSVPRCK